MANKIVRAGIIAAIYFSLCYLLQPFSFYALQFRVSEALTLLPILFPEAVPGLFIGVLLANLSSPFGIIDILGGSITTLIAAYITYRYRKMNIISYLSPVVFNALFISIYIAYFTKAPYLITALYIGLSEALVVFTLGYLLIKSLKKYMNVKDL